MLRAFLVLRFGFLRRRNHTSTGLWSEARRESQLKTEEKTLPLSESNRIVSSSAEVQGTQYPPRRTIRMAHKSGKRRGIKFEIEAGTNRL